MLGLAGQVLPGTISDHQTLSMVRLYLATKDGFGSIRPWRAGGIAEMPCKEYLCLESIHVAYSKARALKDGPGQ